MTDILTDLLDEPDEARCLVCGEPALKAFLAEDAPAADAEYICARCLSNETVARPEPTGS